MCVAARQPWTEEEQQHLAHLFTLRGYSDARAAPILSRTANAVRAQRFKQDLLLAPAHGGPPWTTWQVKRLKTLFAHGLCDADIGESLGRTVYGIRYMRKLQKLFRGCSPKSKRNVPWTDAEYQQLLEMQAAGLSFRSIAKRLNRTRSAVLGCSWRNRGRTCLTRLSTS
jgi:hypothetical protein